MWLLRCVRGPGGMSDHRLRPPPTKRLLPTPRQALPPGRRHLRALRKAPGAVPGPLGTLGRQGQAVGALARRDGPPGDKASVGTGISSGIALSFPQQSLRCSLEHRAYPRRLTHPCYFCGVAYALTFVWSHPSLGQIDGSVHLTMMAPQLRQSRRPIGWPNGLTSG